MEESIHFMDPTRCRDMYEAFKGRGHASIIVKSDTIDVISREIVERDIPLCKLYEKIDMLNEFGYIVCKSKDILDKYKRRVDK